MSWAVSSPFLETFKPRQEIRILANGTVRTEDGWHLGLVE